MISSSYPSYPVIDTTTYYTSCPCRVRVEYPTSATPNPNNCSGSHLDLSFCWWLVTHLEKKLLDTDLTGRSASDKTSKHPSAPRELSTTSVKHTHMLVIS